MELASFSVELWVFLFLVAVTAGLLDTLVGGGGLISMPALILSGVPPLAALGTNKLQGSMGTATATYMMLKNKKVNWNHVKHLMLTAFMGAVLGTIAVQFINTDVLEFVIPAVLVFIAIYFLLSPKAVEIQGEPKLAYKNYKNFVVPVIGYYDGMFGPGTGSFFVLSGVLCRGHDLITATAIAKPLNFATNFASVMVFLVTGHVVWVVGILMMLGQALGAWMGSHFLFKINLLYLRSLIVLMCAGMLVKYAYSMGWLMYE